MVSVGKIVHILMSSGLDQENKNVQLTTIRLKKDVIGKHNMIKKITNFFLIPLVIMMIANALFSVTGSTFFELYMQNELPSYKKDNVFLLIVFLGMWIAVAYSLKHYRVLEKLPYNAMSICNVVYAAIFCLSTIYVFHCGVVSDSNSVNIAATNFLKGDYTSFFSSGYFLIYPYQLHMASYFQLIYSIFGVGNFIAFELLNAIFITVIVFLLQRITTELFDEEMIRKWEIIFSTLLIPLFLYTTFVYGDIPGFTAAVATLYFVIRYLKTDRWHYIIFAGICLSLGTIVKENNTIFLVAIVIVMILKAISKRKIKPILMAVIIILLSQLGVKIVEQYYLQKAGVEEMPEGTPMLSFVAMGNQDNGDETANGPGWHNGFDSNVYVEADYNYDLALERSIDSLKEELLAHIKDPKRGIYFYYKKFVSQWNDPTFQSQIMNEWYSRHVEETPAWEFFNYGKGRDILYNIMNVAHFIMFTFISIGLVSFLKRWSLEGAFVLLGVFGGVIFHEFVWEAKGRYVLPYYVLLVPFAALGCVSFLNWLDIVIEKWKASKTAVDEKV